MEEMELRITDLSRGGAGVGRDHDGRVIFVPLTAPGDRVRIRVQKSEKRYAQGELVEILEASPVRVQPRCPYFGRCGGCEWQHLPYETQWTTKVNGVRHALKRVGIEVESIEELSAAGAEWEYRNRVQLRGNGEKLGFYARGSHEIVPIDRCEITRPEINRALEETRREGARLPREYKVEVEEREGRVLKTWNARHGAAGFRQVHDLQNARLQGWVSGCIPDGIHVLDLYGGSGNLSLPLASRVKGVDCVDIGAPKGPQAQDGVPPRFYFHSMDVHRWLKSTQPSSEPVALILDPPREGLGEAGSDIMRLLDFWRAGIAVLVGCDADAWSRDIARFSRRGWVVREVAALDLFPQTHHVESLALLVRDL